MFLNKFTDYYKKFEIYISIIGFCFGLVFTFLTLTRVDMWLENFWIIVNLLIVAFSIFVLTYYENWTKGKSLPESLRDNLHQIMSQRYCMFSSLEKLIHQGVNIKYYYNTSRLVGRPGICNCERPCQGQGEGDSLSQPLDFNAPTSIFGNRGSEEESW